MTKDERSVYFIKVSSRDSGEIISMITRVDGERCSYDKGFFREERILAVNSDACGYWTWVKNPELTDIYGEFARGDFNLLERRPAPKGELVAIRLAGKLYVAKEK